MPDRRITVYLFDPSPGPPSRGGDRSFFTEGVDGVLKIKILDAHWVFVFLDRLQLNIPREAIQMICFEEAAAVTPAPKPAPAPPPAAPPPPPPPAPKPKKSGGRKKPPEPVHDDPADPNDNEDAEPSDEDGES